MNILFIEQSVNLLDSYINDSTKVVRYSKDSILADIKTAVTTLNIGNVETLGFAFHGVNDITYFGKNTPFFSSDNLSSYPTVNSLSIRTVSGNTMKIQRPSNNTDLSLLNNEVYKYLKELVVTYNIKTINFLGCDLLLFDMWKQYFEYLSETLHITVGASSDRTGNIKYGGDWILESTNQDIKQLYFNETIDNYADLMAQPISVIFAGNANDIAFFNGTAPGSSNTTANNIFTYTGPGTYTMQANLTITECQGFFPVRLDGGFIFDGNGKTITINSSNPNQLFSGLFKVLNGTVKNLTVKTNIGGSGTVLLDYQAGWICASSSGATSGRSCTVINCVNYGNVGDGFPRCGGICGAFCGSSTGTLIITNCTNHGSINSGGGGGICGSRAGINGGNCMITGCTNTGDDTININGQSGGITGNLPGYNGGSCTINNCTSSGIIGTPYSGGICGLDSGYYGTCTITNCSSSGSVSGQEAGGIAGALAGENGSCNITNCYFSGTIDAQKAGGICGSYCGYQGSCIIENCMTTGDITTNGLYAGGICGAAFGQENGSNLCEVRNCVSFGNINGQEAGGIVGTDTGSNTDGVFPSLVTIVNCSTTGTITGQYAGGICGSNCANSRSDTLAFANAFNAYLTIKYCVTIGNIAGSGAGGICGGGTTGQLGYPSSIYTPGVSLCNIYSCITTGQIIGTGAGGITGSYTATGNSGSDPNNTPTDLTDDVYVYDPFYNGTCIITDSFHNYGIPVGSNSEASPSVVIGNVIATPNVAGKYLGPNYFGIHAIAISYTGTNNLSIPTGLTFTANNAHPMATLGASSFQPANITEIPDIAPGNAILGKFIVTGTGFINVNVDFYLPNIDSANNVPDTYFLYNMDKQLLIGSVTNVDPLSINSNMYKINNVSLGPGTYEIRKAIVSFPPPTPPTLPWWAILLIAILGVSILIAIILMVLLIK